MLIGSSPDNGIMKHSIVFNQTPLAQGIGLNSPRI